MVSRIRELSGLRAQATRPEGSRLETRKLREELKALKTGVMCALNMLLDLKDMRTGLHATRLAEWAVRVGESLGIEDGELRDIEAASLLHDIGKIGLPDSILLKPGRLTPEEYAITKKHPEYGWAILRSVPGFERASLLVLHHHERYDGKGYPAGLVGEEIPLGSRIVSIVDAFDAMLSSRAYRDALPVEEAVGRLVADTGKQFDPKISPLFIELARSNMPELLCTPDELPVGLARVLR
jgi:HD-GYP domain-containing protein (c-di-GMP phosphodiesterase class II)